MGKTLFWSFSILGFALDVCLCQDRTHKNVVPPVESGSLCQHFYSKFLFSGVYNIAIKFIVGWDLAYRSPG